MSPSRNRPLQFAATAIGLFALVDTQACAHRPHATPPRVAIVSNDSTLVSIDTSKIVMSGNIARLWIRYDLSNPAIFPDSTQLRVFRMEVESDVDCEGQRAQDVTLRVSDSLGVLMRESALHIPGWQAFPEASQTINIFGPLCSLLRKKATTRGA